MWIIYTQIRKKMRGRLSIIIGMIAVLLFLCAMFRVGNTHMETMSEDVREKLGIYLYLDDDLETEALVTAQALDMVQEFDEIGVSSQFYTKEDAFGVLEKKLPEVTADLEKYGISNPLPPTMYIIFKDEDERTQIKDIVLSYQDIIQNAQDVDSPGFSFTEQERRVVDVLNVLSIARASIIFLLMLLGAIVIGMILFVLGSLYDRFYTDVEVKVLSGLSYIRISAPFLLVGVSVFLGGYILHVGLLGLVYHAISPYMSRLFQSSPFAVIFPGHIYTYMGAVLLGGVFLCMCAGVLLLRRRMMRLRG